MNRITLRHALKRIGAGMTAAVTGAVLLLQIPTAAFAVDDTEGTTSGGFDYTIKDGVVTVTGYSGEDRETVTKLTVPKTISGIAVTKIARCAFERMHGLSSVKLPEGLQRMEDYVFSECENLKELTLPKGIPLNAIASYSYIGGWGTTLRGSSIEKIILEDGAQYVPTDLCYGSEHIREVVMPDTVTEIGASAFQCATITEVTLPDSVKKIGTKAFKNSGITDIRLPEGLTEMGSSVFEGCEGITALTVPSTLTDAYAAIGDSYIETLTIADGMETIPRYLAYHAKNLKTVEIPRSVTAFGDYCFCDTGITEFTVPKQILTGNGCFEKSALETVSFEDGLERIPDKLFSNAENLKTINWISDIAEIGENAFRYCTALETVEIPDTVQTICKSAFEHCEGIQTLRLPEGGAKIGSYAFAYCHALESVYLPMMAIDPETDGYYKGYNEYQFEYSENLKKIEFAPEMKIIPYGVCYHCDSLTDIVFPSAPEKILGLAFQYCPALQTVTIPDSVTAINEFAFAYCESIETLHLPESLNYIGRETFYKNTALKELYLPHELTEYGGYYPFNHSGIEKLVIADGVTAIGSTTFAGMDNLRSVTFPDSLTKIGDKAFLECYVLTGVTLPPNLETISDNSFGYCYNLTEITIPKTLTGKGWAAFNNAGITELTFEDGMTVIPENLFRNLPELKTVHIPASVTEIGKGAFGGCTALETIDAPQESLKFYSTTFEDCDTLDDERFVVCLKKDSFINCTASADAENKMMHYTVYYSVNPRFRELMSDIRLEIKTAWKADIIRESLPEDISAGLGGFSFTPEKPEGVIRFSIRTQNEEDTSVKATLSVKQRNDWDWAGWYSKNIVSPGVPAPELSLNAPSRAKQADGKAAFTVAGYAPVGQEVTLRVTNKNMADTVSEQTVTASAYTGRYTADIEIAAEDSQLLTVEAVCGSLSQKASVVCDANQNRIISALLHHYGKTTDITETFTIGTMPFFSCSPGRPFGFEIELENNDCEMVYVSSTNGSNVSLIQLEFDEETGKWCGEGHFSSSIPGVLNVLTFPKEYNETAFTRKNSDGTETLEIEGHEFLSALADEEDPVAEFVRLTSGKVAASDENGILTSYDCSVSEDEPAGIMSYLGKAESVSIGGKTVTPEDVLKDPEQYGFETSPFVIADEDGTYHAYLVKFLSDPAAVQEVCENILIADDAAPAQGLPSAQYKPERAGYQPLSQRFFDWLADCGEDSDKLTKYANGTIITEVALDHHPIVSPTANLDKDGLAKDFIVTAADTGRKEAVDAFIKAKFPKGGETFNNVTGKAMTYAEIGTSSLKMLSQQRNIIESDVPYVREHETELLIASTGLTMAKATQILVGGAVIAETIGAAAVVIAGGAAVLPELIAVGAVIGVVWGIGKLIDAASNYLDDVVKGKAKVGGDGRTRAIVDPSGIAYEFLPSNPIEGATAKIYYQDEGGKAVLWNAADYDQVNPQITDKDGWYAWDVPEGLWQVRLTKEGYTSTKSDWLPVLPVQVGIDLCMTSELPARFAGAVMNEDNTGIEVKFSKHMKDSTATAESLSLRDKDGEVIPCTISPVKEEGNDTDCSMSYVLLPKESCEVYGIYITPDLQTYAGPPFEDGGMGLDGVKIEKAAGVFGDVDGDGEVTIFDSVKILIGVNEEMIGLDWADRTLSKEQAQIGDIDGDGELTPFDSACVLKYYNLKFVAGLEWITWDDVLPKKN